MNTMQVLKAMANETRMEILTLLLRHNYCVRALANELILGSDHISTSKICGRLLIGENAVISPHYDVENGAHPTARGIEALAGIEQEGCHPKLRSDCPVELKPSCHKKARATRRRSSSATAKRQTGVGESGVRPCFKS